MTLTIDTILQFITLVVMVMLGLLLKSYLPSYLTKKGENLATKEDIEEITSKVERIRSQHASELEALRSRLQSESEVFSRRRAVYDGMVQSLGTFVSDRQATEEAKARFLDDYASMWLWADDQVLRSLNEFLEVNIVYAASRNQSLQPLLRHAYAACVIGMRKDVGFPETTLSPIDYKFVSFSPNSSPGVIPLSVGTDFSSLPDDQTEVQLDGTITFRVEYPKNLTPEERVAAAYLAKIIGPALGTGQGRDDISGNVGNHATLQRIADANGVTLARLLEIAEGIRLLGSRVNGKIRDFRLP